MCMRQEDLPPGTRKLSRAFCAFTFARSLVSATGGSVSPHGRVERAAALLACVCVAEFSCLLESSHLVPSAVHMELFSTPVFKTSPSKYLLRPPMSAPKKASPELTPKAALRPRRPPTRRRLALPRA
eukprot:5363203-Pleurochrysis_carterae.AAC.1